MNSLFKRGLIGACLVFGLASAVRADGMQSLAAFLKNVRAAHGDFTQVVTFPVRQGEATARKKTSSGVFSLERPNKFRFEYRKPFEQLMVSDGRTLSVYDADLDQLTQRPLSEVMPGTPAVMLAGADLVELRKHFELSTVPDEDGLQWVQARPRAKDTSIKAIRVGFDPAASNRLAALQVTDSFGQVSDMRLSQVSYAALPPQTFVYQKKRSDQR